MEDTIVSVEFAGVTEAGEFFGSFSYSASAPTEIDFSGSRVINPTDGVFTFNGDTPVDLAYVVSFQDDVDTFTDGSLFTDIVTIGVNAVFSDNIATAFSVFAESGDTTIITDDGLPTSLDLVQFDQNTFVTSLTSDGVFEIGDLIRLETSTTEATISISPEEAQRVARLYEAALDRDGEIDLEGLNFWIDQREQGLAAPALADAFIRNPEFEAQFGDVDALSDQEYIEVLYRNILDREGEAEGIDFWTGIAEQEIFTRAEILIFFADSQENIDGTPFIDTLTEVEPGVWDFA